MKYFFPVLVLSIIAISVWSLSGSKPQEVPVEEEGVVKAEPAQAKPVPAPGQPVQKRSQEEIALEKTPELKQIWDLIGDNRKEDAIELLREMIRKNPSNDKLLTELGTILTGDKAKAAEGIAALQKALESNPENDEALGNLLFTETSPEKRAEVIAGLKALAESNPNSTNLPAGLGRMLMQQGDFSSAIAYLEKGSTDPKFAESSLSGLIDAYKEMGQLAQSANAYERLVAEQERKLDELTKSGQRADSLERRVMENKLGLAAMLIDAGQLDSADRVLQQIRERDPQRAELTELTRKLSQKRAG